MCGTLVLARVPVRLAGDAAPSSISMLEITDTGGMG